MQVGRHLTEHAMFYGTMVVAVGNVALEKLENKWPTGSREWVLFTISMVVAIATDLMAYRAKMATQPKPQIS